MSRDAALFIVAACLALGVGLFCIVFVLGLLRHWQIRRRAARRIGWYS